MRLGIISDVHSNIDALQATFEAFEQQKVDQIICMGDVIGIGPYPDKCIQFLIDNKHKIKTFVKGNHENYLLKGIPIKNHNDKNAKPMIKEQMATHKWNHSRVNSSQKEYIRNLKDKDCIEIQGNRIIVEHYPMDKNNKFKTFIKNPNKSELNELFEDKSANIYLFGHTHQRCYISDGGKHYINPGSLGCPININAASAGILEIHNDKVEYRQLQIQYDIERVINEIILMDYPLCDFMINNFYKKQGEKA